MLCRSEKGPITYTVFFAAQNSSYGGDGRFSTLSSSREDTLVGFPLNLSRPRCRNCRFCSMRSCMCKLSSLSLLMSVPRSFIRITVKVHLGAVINMIDLIQIYPHYLAFDFRFECWNTHCDVRQGTVKENRWIFSS